MRLVHLRLMLLALLTFIVGGCGGFTHNPSYFPYLKLPGDIEPTHAKPRGHGYFADFDPHAKTLVVRPEEGASPVKGQVVVIATVYDEKGQPRRSRRVEWMLEGAGSIVEVDESGYFPGRGYKVDNRYAVSYTDYFEHKITRGNENPNDDFVIRPGQSWCVITSSVEGDSHLTCYAPGIHNWEKNKIHITRHWIDAQWVTPPPCTVAAGTPHVLTTNVFRHADRQPLAGYRIRYQILDGPPAVFLPSRAQEAVATSDLRGNASVQIVQQRPGAGSNRVGIEIIRAPDPTAASAPGIVVGKAETRIDWQSPGLALGVGGPPALSVNQEGTYNITLTNPGQIPLRTLTVRHFIPPAAQFVRSDPPAIIEGEQLIWTLGELAPGKSRELQVVLKQTQPVRADHRIVAQSEEGLRDEKTVSTLGTQPALKLNFGGPATGTVGSPVPYKVTLTNPGSGPTTGIVLKASFDDGLEADAGTNPVELRLPEPLAPGQSREVPLSLRPKRGGDLVVRVTVTADGGVGDKGEHLVQVREAKIALSLLGPRSRVAGRSVTWNLEASNTGATTLTNLVLRQELPAEVEFVAATEGGQLSGREVVWNLGTVRAGEKKNVQATVNAVTLTPSVPVRALATASPESGEGSAPTIPLRADAETTLEIRGVPAFRMEVSDESDPIEVGGRTRYRIEVMNQGSLRGSGIQVTATVSKQMRILSAQGQGPYKIEGDRITFDAMDGLEAKQTWTYIVEVEAKEPGDARLSAELRAATLSQPVVVQQSTTVFTTQPLVPTQ